MASIVMIVALLLCAAVLALPSYALTCTSQKFTTNKTFTDCIDLPVLDAYLHYTYNSANSSLSIAYVAPPPKPEGWVAWAINPTSEGMIGAQALLAYKSNKDSVVVKTYDIKSYAPPKESKLSFAVWEMSGESNGDNLVIFATVKVPEKAEKVNQVWQVGSSVTNEQPGRHEMNEANTNAKGELKLSSGGNVGGPSAAPSGSSPGGSTPGKGSAAPVSDDDSAGTSMMRKLSIASCMGVIVVMGSLIGL